MAELEEEEECGGSPESLEGVFQQAAEWMRNNRSLKLTAAQKLSLYGLFKQVKKISQVFENAL